MKKQTLGERIRALREHYGHSQKTFAASIGLSAHSPISEIERGVVERPQEDTLNEIVAVYGTTKEWLLHGIGEMLPNGMLKGLDKEAKQTADAIPYRDYAIKRLEREVESKEKEAETWKEKYTQVWARLEFFMDRLPLGKSKPVSETAYAQTGS